MPDIQFHDSEIISIAFDRITKIAQLELRTEDNKKIVLQFSNVTAFRAEDFVLQNVVNRVLQSTKNEMSPKVIERWLLWATASADTPSWLTEISLKELIIACETGKLEIVVIEPSAGAQIVIICEHMQII